MKISWDDSFSTGIAEIDAQHKDFIKLVQRLQILAEKDATKDFILRVLQEMEKYTEYHFMSEENLMWVCRYPRIKTQQMEHQKLLRVLRYKIRAFEDNLETLDSLIDFLLSWFQKHIKEEDIKIQNYIRGT